MIYKKLKTNIDKRGLTDYNVWGKITGNINNQLDLKNVLDSKQNAGTTNLANGDNIVISPEGPIEFFINTTDNIKLSDLTGRNNNAINVNSEMNFKDTPNFELGANFITGENSTELELSTDGTFKITNSNQILLTDNQGPLNVRTINNTVNTLIDELKAFKPFTYRGEYETTITYNQNDVVTHTAGQIVNTYLSLVDNNLNQPLTDKTKWKLFSDIVDLTNYYNKTQVDNLLTPINTAIQTLENSIEDNTQSIINVSDNHVLKTDIENWNNKLLYGKTNQADNTQTIINAYNLAPQDIEKNFKTINNSIDQINKNIETTFETETQEFANVKILKGLRRETEDGGDTVYKYGYFSTDGTISIIGTTGTEGLNFVFPGLNKTDYDGIYLNGTLIPWGTTGTNGGITITMGENSFSCNQDLDDIPLYKIINRQIHNENVERLIGEYEVNWRSKSTFAEAGNNLKTIINDNALWSDITSPGNKYKYRLVIHSRSNVDGIRHTYTLSAVNSQEASTYYVLFGAGNSLKTIAYSLTDFRYITLQLIITDQGAPYFFVTFDSSATTNTLNTNFEINKVYLYKTGA